MTQENTQHRYSITDILGAPCSEEEARRRIREETDLTTLNVFHSMQTAAQERLLEFIMGKRGLAITYDTVFRHVLVPNGNPERLEHFTSDELRKAWKQFYIDRGHVDVGAVSLVSDGSTGVMFNVAGMQPLMPYLQSLVPRGCFCPSR